MVRAMLPLLVAALAAPAAAQQPPPAVTTVAPAAAPLAAATRLARWQLAHFDDGTMIARVTDQTRNRRAWEQAVFWIGLAELADAMRSPEFTAAVRGMGEANGWAPGPRPYHADDFAITQAYLMTARGAGARQIAPTRAALDRILAAPPRVGLGFYEGKGAASGSCLDRWCWCDALFMAPPAWFEMARRTGNRAYRDFALKEFWATTDFLYDPVEHLFYRDSRFFERRGPTGAKQFWSRGNGWVMAGMARSIPLLPPGADRTRMVALFREMAARLRDLQKPDGYWAPSLLETAESPPESSGTAFYIYALAWGIDAGLLDRAAYEPNVRRSWDALTRAVRPDGRLGWVQQVSYLPEKVQADDTQYYGTGAFLLAATAVARLDAHVDAHRGGRK